MRKLIALLTIFSFNAHAVAPTGVGGEQGALSYTNNLKAPNYQVTSLGGVNSRIESGNTNLLMNPSFEHPTVGTGWTVTNATSSADITNMVEGKKALSLAVTGVMVVSQDSTINAANINGLQGVASVKIKATGTTGLKVCPRNAGAAVSSLCVNVTADNTWKHVSIPFILGATSNGIGIATTATGGTVYIDDAFVGTSAPFQNVQSETVYSASVSTSGVVSNESFDWINGNCTSASPNICTFNSNIFTVTPNCWASIQNNTAQAYNIVTASTTASQVAIQTQNTTSGGSSNGIAYYLYCQKQGKDMPLASKIYSQASQDYDWTSYTPTFGAGFGTVTNPNCYHQRRGHNLSVVCYPTSGTTAASIGSISLPSGLSIDTNVIKATNTSAQPGQVIGEYQSSTGGSNNSWIVTATSTSTSNVYVGGVLGGATPTTPVNMGSILGNNTAFNVKFTVPISGWSDYGVIVGSFAGIEKCANDYECTDTFSAQVSAAGVVSNENIDWINGNAGVVSGTYTLTFNTNLKDGTSSLTNKMNCVATFDRVTNNNMTIEYDLATSTNAQAVIILANTSGTQVTDPFTIKCQKGSQDYKPKTAKVASSIGVPTVPGITTQAVDTFSVSFGTTNATTVCSASPCSYLDQIGTAVTSVTRGVAGAYTLNLNKTYSKLKCSGGVSVSTTGSRPVGAINCSSSCSSVSFQTLDAAFAQADTYGTLICQGTY